MISSEIVITNNLSGIWLIEFGSYKWASSDYVYGDEFYSGKIKGFDNFTEIVCRPNDKQISEKTLDFSILDEEKEISAAKGDELTLRLIINGEQFLSWKFVVQTFTNFYGNSNFTCIDFFSFNIQNKLFPNTQLINTLDSSSGSHSGTEDACIPVIFGEPYIPLRSIKINGYQRYILGIDDGSTYSIDRIAYPVEWGSNTEYLSTSYTFTQESFSGLRVFTPYIGANNTAGHFQERDSLLDAPVKYSKSSTSSLNDYSDVIKNVLILMGVSSSDIDTTSFDNCKAIFASIGLECNVGYWHKRSAEEVICELLASCNSIIQIYDKIYLQYIGDTSVVDIDRYDIAGFNFSESIEDNYGDSGILQYYEDIQSGDPINVYIPLKAGSYNKTSDITQTDYTFEKISGTESWDSESITSSFYFSDGCRLRFSFDSAIGDEMIVGLTSSISSTPSYTDIDHGFLIDSVGRIYVYEDGVISDLSLTYSTVEVDIFEIIYNGTSIIYNVNDIRRKTTAGVSTSLDFYVEAQIKDIGGTFSILSFDQYIKTDENEDSKSFLIPFTNDSVLCQKIARLYFRRSNLKIGEISFNSRKRLLFVECGDTITINDEIYHSDDYYVTQKSIGFDLSLSFTCDRYSEAIGSLSDFSPSAITFDSSGYDYIVPLSQRWLKEIYIRATSQPATPTGESPVGWEEVFPTGSDPLWMSRTWFRNDGTIVSGEEWSEPIRIEGLDGSSGSDARAVNLTVTDQGINYDSDGLNPDPSSCTVTATALNTSGTVYYEFLLNDASVQHTTSNTYTYTPEASFDDMPSKITVYIREDSTLGTVLARDQITIFGLKEGLSAIFVILSNEAHTLPTTNTGVVTYTGSGTTIEAYEGGTQLTIDQNSPYSNGTFRVSASGTNITPGTGSGSDGGATITYGNHSNMVADSAYVTYSITVVNSAGTEILINRVQSLAKSIQGSDGLNGDEGSAGIDARAVNLTITDQSISYDSTGLNPDPSSCTVTATAFNTTGTVYYQFLLNDISVQHTTSSTYTYTPKPSFDDMPEKITCQIREGSTSSSILAVDQITVSGVLYGASAITTILSNEAHTLPTTNLGAVTYTGSGTTIEVYEGGSNLLIDQNSPFGIGTFRVSAVGTNITPGTRSGSDGGSIITYGNHSNMTADNAYITYTISIITSEGKSLSFNRVQSFAKSIQGEDGDSTPSRSVNLTSNYQGFTYNSNGLNPSPASATITATALNTTGTVYYQFLLEGAPVQNLTASTYTYTPKASSSDMPDRVEVRIREGGTTGDILARDQITLYGIVPGSDAATVILSNEAHALPTTNLGVITYTGSGTNIYAYIGSTQLTVDQNSPYGNNTFRVSAVGTNITPGTESGADGSLVIAYGNHSNMTANTAFITYTITVVDSNGVGSSYTKLQTFSKALQGADGIDGEDGDPGTTGPAGDPGPGLIYRGEWDNTVQYVKDDIRRDIVTYLGNWYAVITTNTGVTPTNVTYWEASDPMSFVATDILLANSVAILEDLTIGWSDLDGHMANCSIRSGMSNPTTGDGFFIGRSSGNVYASFKSGSTGLFITPTGSSFFGSVTIGPGSSGINNFSDASLANIDSAANTKLTGIQAGADATDYSLTEIGGTFYGTPTYIERYGNSFEKVSGGNAWNAQFYSLGYYVGNCHLKFIPGQTTSSLMVGINTDPASAVTYASIDYCFYLTPTVVYIWESGTSRGTFAASYTINDIFEIIYDGNNINYYINSSLVRSVDVSGTPNIQFYCDSSIYTQGAIVKNVSFDRFGDITKTVINGGVITTGYIGDDLPSSLGGTPNMCIDFANALIEIGHDGGLTVESGGGVTLDSGAGFIVSSGADFSLIGGGSFIKFKEDLSSTSSFAIGKTSSDSRYLHMSPLDPNLGNTLKRLAIGGSGQAEGTNWLNKWETVRVQAFDQIDLMCPATIVSASYRYNYVRITDFSSELFCASNTSSPTSGRLYIGHTAGGVSNGTTLSDTTKLNLLSDTGISITAPNITITGSSTRGRGVAISLPHRTTAPTAVELPNNHYMIYRVVGVNWLTIAWNVDGTILAGRFTN